MGQTNNILFNQNKLFPISHLLIGCDFDGDGKRSRFHMGYWQNI
jgi:hypothetical protein